LRSRVGAPGSRCELARLLLPEFGGEASRFVQVIERGARSAGECFQASRGLLLNFADVGRVDAKQTAKRRCEGRGPSSRQDCQIRSLIIRLSQSERSRDLERLLRRARRAASLTR
jgi:hypothetical protein